MDKTAGLRIGQWRMFDDGTKAKIVGFSDYDDVAELFLTVHVEHMRRIECIGIQALTETSESSLLEETIL